MFEKRFALVAAGVTIALAGASALLAVGVLRDGGTQEMKGALAVTVLLTLGLAAIMGVMRRRPGLAMAATGAASVMVYASSTILQGWEAQALLVPAALLAALSLWSLYRMMEKERDGSGSYL